MAVPALYLAKMAHKNHPASNHTTQLHRHQLRGLQNTGYLYNQQHSYDTQLLRLAHYIRLWQHIVRVHVSLPVAAFGDNP